MSSSEGKFDNDLQLLSHIRRSSPVRNGGPEIVRREQSLKLLLNTCGVVLMVLGLVAFRILGFMILNLMFMNT